MIVATFYSNHTTNKIYGVNTVLHDNVTHGAFLKVCELLPAAVVLQQAPNTRCSCGSGDKYRKCHGALKYLYFPLTHRISFENTPFPASGQLAAVACQGAAGR
jgi:hypothetical protein